MLEILRIKDRCTGCGSCVNICPAKALTMEYDDEHFYFPQLNKGLCNDCRLCEIRCPALSIKRTTGTKLTEPFYSSKTACSGKAFSFEAIFTMLSEKVISEGGIVYGTRYDCKRERAEYASSKDYEPSVLGKFTFIEPYTGEIFTDIRTQAENGRDIVFCGTPCHIHGLKTYLGKYFPNILFVEHSCRGVISNRHFTVYKNKLEKKYRSPIIDVDFRSKKKGLSMRLEFANRKNTILLNYKCLYNKPFNAYCCLRRACYTCAFPQKTADIVIGNAENIIKDKYGFQKSKRYSFVVTNSEKGEALIDSLKHLFVRHEMSLEKMSSIYDNKTVSYRSYLSLREQLLANIKKYGYIKALKKHVLKYCWNPCFIINLSPHWLLNCGTY